MKYLKVKQLRYLMKNPENMALLKVTPYEVSHELYIRFMSAKRILTQQFLNSRYGQFRNSKNSKHGNKKTRRGEDK